VNGIAFGAIVSVMSSRAHRLIEEFFTLPESEQVEVLQAIVPEGDDDEMGPALVEELARRVRRIQDGTAVLHDHEDVRRDFMNILKR
jgi:hypothetical protein